MAKLFAFLFLVSNIIVVTLGDPERPGRYIHHSKKITNCAKYSREHNQYQCVLSPFNVEGPYFLPDDHERSDILDGQEGLVLDLTINIVNAIDCTPMEHMYVHLWQANALGQYSGVFNQVTLNLEDRPTPISDERFLRGYQLTDANGQVKFRTIIPGWYATRSLHTHLEVYPKNSTSLNDMLYVGQIFYISGLPDQLKLIAPYSFNTADITYNDQDQFYPDHGNETILNLIKQQDNSYSGQMIFGLDPNVKPL